MAKSDMLHNYALWGSLEAYWRGVTFNNVYLCESTYYLIKAKVEMTPNDATCGGLEAYWSRVTWNNIIGAENGKNLWMFSSVLTHYLINAWLAKGGILANYAPWCGLEAYWREVNLRNYFWWKWEITWKVSIWKVLPLIWFVQGQRATLRGSAFSEQYFLSVVISVA